MGRPLTPDDDGLVFHAVSRGNNRDVVFRDDGDFLAFLHAMGRPQLRYPFRLYGYCLMTNHFHLLLRPEPGVAIGRVKEGKRGKRGQKRKKGTSLILDVS